MKTIKPNLLSSTDGSFSRSTTGTYYNSSGVLTTAAINAPRFNYNPSTKTFEGLLIEEQRTNLLTYSEDVSNGAWLKIGTQAFGSGSTANAAVAPDGQQTADLLTENTINSGHYVEFSVTRDATLDTTFSVFLKPNGRTDVIVVIYDWTQTANNLSIRVNISTGAIITAATAAGSAVLKSWSVTNVGNGWYQVSIGGVVGPSTGGTIRPRIQYINASATYTGDGTSGVFIWGAQLEAGSFPTSYIPTTTTQVTRTADTITGSGLIYSTATDPNALWSSATTYALGNKVRYASKIWESLQATNLNHQPDTSPTWWLDLGADNIHAAFDTQVSTVTTATNELTFVVKAGSFNSAALIDVDAAIVEVALTDPVLGTVYTSVGGLSTTTVYNWYEYFFNDPLLKRTQLIFYNIPQYVNAYFTVRIKYPSSTISLAQAIFGLISEIGTTQYGVSSGIIDYSVKETDEFGNTTFVKRAFSKRVNANLFLPNSELNRVQRYMYSIRAEPSVWIVSEDPTFEEPLVVFGYYRDFSTEIAYPAHSLMSIEIEGLT